MSQRSVVENQGRLPAEPMHCCNEILSFVVFQLGSLDDPETPICILHSHGGPERKSTHPSILRKGPNLGLRTHSDTTTHPDRRRFTSVPRAAQSLLRPWFLLRSVDLPSRFRVGRSRPPPRPLPQDRLGDEVPPYRRVKQSSVQSYNARGHEVFQRLVYKRLPICSGPVRKLRRWILRVVDEPLCQPIRPAGDRRSTASPQSGAAIQR
mmetsp:Transcript_1606/g.4822  ORF Transcript_1606/g.4822 Transcript_1606/m.4822 type:complete len:208 (+) Transcript_1606:1368-1991(+)